MCRLRTRESRNPVEWGNRVPVAGSVPVFPRVSLRLAPDATTALHGGGRLLSLVLLGYPDIIGGDDGALDLLAVLLDDGGALCNAAEGESTAVGHGGACDVVELGPLGDEADVHALDVVGGVDASLLHDGGRASALLVLDGDGERPQSVNLDGHALAEQFRQALHDGSHDAFDDVARIAEAVVDHVLDEAPRGEGLGGVGLEVVPLETA